MALNKQKILSELGSVMNQLQTADCGCIGKLFSNPGQSAPTMSNPLPTCGGGRHGCWHGHGFNGPSAGEPQASMDHHCRGHCNPPKLYTDTYSYLNENLMQPLVREVYNDLKTISPANTVMNDPMANQIGLSGQANNARPTIQSNMGNVAQYQMPGVMDSSTLQNTINANSNQQMRQIGGMGPQIVDMMSGDGSSKPNNMVGQHSQLATNEAPQPPHGQIGLTPLNALGSANQAQFNPAMGRGNPAMQQQNLTSMYSGGIEPNSNTRIYPSAQNNISSSQQMRNQRPIAGANNQSYGVHTQGMAKFNEMFPGVMQGLGGDLNFDPMSIAIQMNPENKQRATMDTMKQMMVGNGLNKVPETPAIPVIMEPVTAGAASIVQSSSKQAQQNMPSSNQLQHNVYPDSQMAPPQELQVDNRRTILNKLSQIPQQQVYSAVTGTPTINQTQQQFQEHQQYQTQYHQPAQQQQIIDPNTGAALMPPTLPALYEEPTAAEMQQYSSPQESSAQQLNKEPIFPVDTSKNQPPPLKQQKYYEYNTLGQPVEMLPARMFHIPQPNLPQTLAPQAAPAKLRNYSNVKPTVSKTTLMGKQSIGKTPSRSQLQQIYNQYKGSQSFTQQNIRASGYGGTQSEGQLKVAPENAKMLRQVPVERVGGDTIGNNQMASNQVTNKVEQVIGQIGDVPVAKTQGDDVPQRAVGSKHSKCRNGLQDMTYTSYPSSAAWSFHGNRAACSAGHHFRNRA